MTLTFIPSRGVAREERIQEVNGKSLLEMLAEKLPCLWSSVLNELLLVILQYVDTQIDYMQLVMRMRMNARPRECAILSQPDARAGRTRGLFYCRAMSDPLVTN